MEDLETSPMIPDSAAKSREEGTVVKMKKYTR